MSRQIISYFWVVIAAVFLNVRSARGQEPRVTPMADTLIADDGSQLNALLSMSLEELTKQKVSVPTKTDLGLRETPGTVTLISKEEIRSAGARDLIDVLRLVPGFEFGVDVRGVTGLGIRGNWALEGKALILWDGLTLNEQLFQSTQFGFHYPVDLIERIEIIRGPGSAVYGEEAELGVINIISTSAAMYNGLQTGASFGRMTKARGHEKYFVSLGNKQTDGEFYLSMAAANASRSDADMTDYYPENKFHSYSMAGQSDIRSLFMNAGVSYLNFQAKLLIDRYNLTDRTMYGRNLPSAPTIDFHTYIFDLSSVHEIGLGFKITPRLTYTQNTPWQCVDKNYNIPIYLDKWVENYYSGIAFQFDPAPNVDIQSGIEFKYTLGHALDSSFYLHNPANKKIDFNNTALFFQGLMTSSFGNYTLGARWEHNSMAGSSFVPRFAFTKVINDFHIKTLFSFAFRSPSLENISRKVGNQIKPEKTSVAELEVGAQLSSFFFITADVFYIRLNDPIIFFVDPPTQVSGYRNGPRTGTMGFEADMRFKTKLLYCDISYSHYSARDNRVDEYTVKNNESYMLAFAKHKISFNSSFSVSGNLIAGLSGSWLSGRYYDIDVLSQQVKSKSKLLLNLYLNYHNIVRDGLDIGFGVYDILNVHYSFIQPYNGGTAPLPGPTREFFLKLAYTADF